MAGVTEAKLRHCFFGQIKVLGHLSTAIKVLTVSITGIALALQLAFTAFLSAIIEMDT
jgi:hypothetical protein